VLCRRSASNNWQQRPGRNVPQRTSLKQRSAGGFDIGIALHRLQNKRSE
jgi:hypothetical protein